MRYANIIWVIEMDIKIGNRIRECRKSQHLTQETLAAILHVHQTAISQWEKGKTEPDMSNILKMAEMFSVSAEYLMGATEGRTTQDSAPREEVIDIIATLSPEEVQRVLDFVSGIIASRAK